MRYFLGMDAGASKTFCVVGDETGRLLGFGRGGSGNHQGPGLEAVLVEYRRAGTEALQQAGLTGDQVEFGAFCLAGADLPQDYAMLTPAVRGLGLAREIIVKNDTMAALRSGLSRSWGVTVICGSGTNAAGRGPDGTEIVFPGLGWMSGDWGGGGDLAREAIRRIMRAWDGRGPETLLTDLILDALGLPDMEALLHALYSGAVPHRAIYALPPLIFEAAYRGDVVAQELLIMQGEEVGITAGTLIRRLGLEDTDVEVVLGGSIFKGKGPLLLDVIRERVHRVAPRARIVVPEFEPVIGAWLIAREAVLCETPSSVYERLRQTMPDALRRPEAKETTSCSP
ncbi:MAG: N-acetylglucosamine kinase [Anaerolineae bacterium]